MCSINLQAIMANKTYPEAGEILFEELFLCLPCF